MRQLMKVCMMIGLFACYCQGNVAHAASGDYQYSSYGNTGNVTTVTSYGINLMGGGTDVDEAMLWMAKKANQGDFVVLRTSGTDGYNQYLYDLGQSNNAKLDSVETIVLNNKYASSDSFVLDKVRKAEAVFFAGGDQFNYVDFIKNTALEDVLNQHIQNNVPIGGTSAGLAIMGQFVYDAKNGSVYSDEALANPNNRYMTFSRDFLNNRYLSSTITDTHFEQRDRMGRFIGFMARNVSDGWTNQSKGIAVNEQTALLVEQDGTAKVVAQPGGSNQSVYMAKTTAAPTSSIGKPLTINNVELVKLRPGNTFNLQTWTSSNGYSYKLSAQNGALSSTSGSIYGN
ncbi:cyanophycinase [Peribacillus muralis]|uniref:cyanophycinase n=1 Tax=Peribacillus muralis TaxID=264697 RepID=UPI001F4ECF7C|nr:cyanophycinase [Peribacillus muralis]MCK1992370.1 cyanophycinase [Peribacillus muralis]MCK2012926.1 cyanophycinase [Peribacillus muralis]